MARIKICKDKDCKNASTTEGFCRLHYLKNWKKLREKKHKQSARKLNKYIDYICKNSPDRYMEVIKKNIRHSDFADSPSEQPKSDSSLSDSLFSDPNYQEEVNTLIDKLKAEKEF
jgi:hypothetical protein